MKSRDRQFALGRDNKRHVLILASGEKIRHVTIRPWMALSAAALATLVTIGYIGSASYMFFRDDLFNAALARQARMQNEYEQRISALRIQVESLTTRQYRDQQLVEDKVAKIIDKQKELAARDQQIEAILSKSADVMADNDGIDRIITHSIMPERKASMTPGTPFDALLKRKTSADTLAPAPTREKQASLAHEAGTILANIDDSLMSIETRQINRIAAIAQDAARKSEKLGRILASTGLRPSTNAAQGMGGPYFDPLDQNRSFERHLDYLDYSIEQFNSLRTVSQSLPLASPAPGKAITSRFGNRIDPFLGRLALHGGIDFDASTGDPVHSTGAGTVIFSGTSGGYGKMVEVEHQDGLTTRYGHLSQISVAIGDEISAGDIVGKAGSTGRSTGPHVHYEVRKDSRPLDPIRFLSAGKEISSLIQ